MRKPGIKREKANSRSNRSEELVLVASELFMERGFESVTIKDIAQAVGVNTALIYYYFKNKEDLLRATIESLVDQALQTYEQIHEKHDRPRDVIDDWIDTHVQLRDPIRKLVKISLDYRGLRRKSRHIDKAIDRFYEREHQILEDVIERGMRQGEFRSVDANSFARFISIHLDGIMVASVIRPEIDPTNGMEYLRGIIGQQLGNSTSSNGLRGINPGAGGRQKQA